MPDLPVKDVRSSGTLRSKSSSTAGPADEFQSATLINADGVLVQNGNQGTAKSRIYGDGSLWTPILPAAPSVLTPGRYFIQTYLGEDWLCYVDSLGVVQRLKPTTDVPITVVVPTSPTTIVVDSALVDTYQYISWDIKIFKPTTGQMHGGEAYMGNDGSTGADATAVQFDLTYHLNFGALAVTLTQDLTGTGVTQTMRLLATASEAGWSVTVSRRARL